MRCEHPISRPCRSRVWPLAKPEGWRKTDTPRFLGPAQNAVVWQVADQQVVGVGKPHRPFQPSKTLAQRQQLRIRQASTLKRGSNLESSRASLISVRWHGRRTGGTCSCTVISTAGSSPIVPERWPLRPSAPAATLVLAEGQLARPHLDPRAVHRSTHQRPESGTIHCGAGFSCQSPTQPTGCTVNTVGRLAARLLLFHCGSAAPTPLSSNSGQLAACWWLTPSSSVHRCQ